MNVEILKGNPLYHERSQHAIEDLGMSTLIYVSDKRVDEESIKSDWRAQLILDSFDKISEDIFPTFWSRENDNEWLAAHAGGGDEEEEDESLLTMLDIRDNELPAIMLLDRYHEIIVYPDSIDDAEHLTAELLASWTDKVTYQTSARKLKFIIENLS